jgi:hypothetical protein
VVNTGGSADEIDNGIDRADLVEVDGFDGDAMQFGFGFSDALKHGKGGVANLLGQLRFFEEVADFRPVAAVVMVMIVVMMVARFLDQETETGKAAPDSIFGLQHDLFGQV